MPVTTIISSKPKIGHEKKALDWFHIIFGKASHFKGYLGSNIFEPVNNNIQRKYAIIFHFDTYENLMIWENSEERIEQLEFSKPFFEEIKPKVQLTGLEYWFENNNAKTGSTPAKWKMLIITIAIIFSLFNTLIPSLRNLFIFIGWPSLINSFLSIVIMVSLMSYIIMHMVTKIAAQWLFKRKKPKRP